MVFSVYSVETIKKRGYKPQSEATMPKHRQGQKFSGSHTTIIETAEVVADTAAKEKEVTKICLGPIQVTPSKMVRLKFRPILAGFEVVVYGRKSIQTLYVYTTDTEKTKRAIEKAFN